MSDIKFVVNFDFPNNTEDYVHRIGRTARAKNTGTAYTYFTTQNAKQAKELVEVLREANQNINPKLYEMMQLAKQIFHSKSKCAFWRCEVCMCGGVHVWRYVWKYACVEVCMCGGVCVEVCMQYVQRASLIVLVIPNSSPWTYFQDIT